MNPDITSENVADDVSARPPKTPPQEETIETTEAEAPAENIFESWNLSKEVLKSLAEMKFTNPTQIQTQAIPMLLKREKDFVGLAATGTGKTGAFGIPLVESIDPANKSVQALVMCPTRELATQVEAQIQKIGKWKGLNTLTVFGGSSYDRQLLALKRGVHIVVGTPGRLIDLMERKALKLENVQTLVLDEADEMISMGFQEDLEKILQGIGDDEAKRKWLFSATMSPEIRRVASRYLPEYDKVEIHKKDSEKPNIEQVYYTIYPDRKLQMLSSVLYMNQDFYGLIFCQTKREVVEITEWLKRKSFPVDCIHGDRPQREREFILNDFRKGRVKILVATDVAARGLDINDLTHVINFSLPREVESYVHRIGRTGRAGKKGLALSIVAPHEVRLMKRIQQVTKAVLTKGKAPTNDELNVYRVKDVIQEMNQAEKSETYQRAAKFMQRKMEEMKELFNFEFTAEEFLTRYLVAEHPDIFENRETSMDFVGDGVVPREMQEYGSRERGPVGRDSSGPRDSYRDRGFSRGGDRGGYRERSFDRGDRGDRPARSFDRGGDREDRGGDRPARSFDRDQAPSDRPYRSNDRGNDRYASARPGGSDRGFTRREESAPAGRSWNADDASTGERPQRSGGRFTQTGGFRKNDFGFGDEHPRTDATTREGRPNRSTIAGDSKPRRERSFREKRDR